MNSHLKPSLKPSPKFNPAATCKSDAWVEAIDHIQITSPPEMAAEMAHFYGVVLCLREVPKPEGLKANGGAWYELGLIQLHIGLEQNACNDASRRHLCFQVRDMEQFRKHLEAQEIPIIADKQPLPNCDRFYLRDPGGNRIEIIHRSNNC
jgi:catechol-2,3-dioxygenase